MAAVRAVLVLAATVLPAGAARRAGAQVYTPLTREEERQLVRHNARLALRRVYRDSLTGLAGRTRALERQLRDSLRADTSRWGQVPALARRRARVAYRDFLDRSAADSLRAWGLEGRVPLLQAFGVGSVNLADIAKDPSAQLMVNFAILPRSNLFLAFNKGAGIAAQSVDSVNLRSLIFPSTGDLGFVANLTTPLEWIPIQRFPGYQRLADRSSSFVGQDVNWSLSLFTEVSVQKRTVASRELPAGAPDSATVDRTFDALQWHVGPRLQVAYYPSERGRLSNGFRLIAGLSWAYLRVTNASKDDFRAIFARAVPRDSVLPRIFHGPSFKAGVELNGVSFDAEFTGYRASRRGDPRTLQHVRGVTGTQIIVRTNLAAPIVEF